MRIVAWACGALFLLASALRADPLQLAHADSLRDNTWELLRITLDQLPDGPPPAGASITLQDARGGLAVTRLAPAAHAGDALLLPLPAVATGALSDRWPLRLTIAGRAPVTIAVPLPPAGTAPAFRVAVPRDVETLRGPIAPPGTRLELIHLSDEEYLSASPLLFAGVDAVFLPRRMTENFPEERAAALAGAGPRLIAPEDEEVGLGSLRHMAWTRMLGADGNPVADLLWRFPAGDPHSLAAALAPRLAPIDPGLDHVPGLLAPPTAGVRTRRVIILVPLAALVLLLLARGLFRRGALMLAVTAVAMLGLLAGALRLLQTDAAPQVRRAHWIDGGGGLRVDESLAATAAFFSNDLHQRAEPGQILTPVWPAAEDYFAESCTLDIDLPTDTQAPTPAGSRAALLAVRIPPRQGVATMSRWSQSAPGFRAAPDMQHPNDTTPAWWIVAGHLVDAAGPPPRAPDALAGPALSQWFADQGPAAADLRAWYELRFDARQRYLLSQPPYAPPEIITVAPQ
ncbi:MAG TPA: hypothetical protein VH253_17790 [Phycisphaerae bacterium]|nr:hypothetical protein [Phycisphaerae bacterium]